MVVSSWFSFLVAFRVYNNVPITGYGPIAGQVEWPECLLDMHGLAYWLDISLADWSSLGAGHSPAHSPLCYRRTTALPRDHAVDMGVRFIDSAAGVSAVAVLRISGFYLAAL
jgi:hypothetical protein